MLDPAAVEETVKRVRRLEIRARRLVRETFAGEYHSSFKGQGLDFNEFREYQHGDEIRFLDWNVTARMGTPYIRTFREERELTVILAVDVSGSSLFGSKHLSKRELAAELAAILGFSARENGDKTGLLLFANEPLLFLPPSIIFFDFWLFPRSTPWQGNLDLLKRILRGGRVKGIIDAF